MSPFNHQITVVSLNIKYLKGISIAHKSVMEVPKFAKTTCYYHCQIVFKYILHNLILVLIEIEFV